MRTLAEFLAARLDEDEADHIGRYDPDRALREVEAKRAILRAYEMFTDPQDQFEAEIWRTLATDVLPPIAAVYRDHPDYRQEWKD